MLRWAARCLAALSIVFGASIVAVLLFVHSDCGRERVKGKVEDALRDTFPGGATIGRLDGSAFDELVAYDVVINTADKQRMVRIGTLRIDLALWPLMSHVARIEKLVAEDVDVVITGAPLSNAPPSPEPSEPTKWSVELRAFEVRRAKVTVAGAGELSDVALSGSFALPAGGPTSGKVLLAGTWQGQRVTGDIVAALGTSLAVPRAILDVGGVHVEAHDVVADAAHPSGRVTIHAPAAAVRAAAPAGVLERLAPYELADAHVEASATGNDGELAVTFGQATVHALVHGDLAARRGSAVISLRDGDATQLTRGAIVARGDALAAFGFDGTKLDGMIYAHGSYEGYPTGDAHVAVSGTRDGGTVTVLAAGPGGLAIAAAAEVVGKRLASSRVVASAGDLKAASARPDLGGRATVELAAQGMLEPLALDITGRVEGTALRFEQRSVGRLSATVDGVIGPTVGTLGATHVVAQRIWNAGAPVGDVTIDARNCERQKVLVVRRGARTIEDRRGCDHDKLLVQLAGRPAGTAVAIDAGATVAFDTPGLLADIGVGLHRVRLPNRDVWSGGGGRVTVSDARQVSVRGLRTAHGDASLAIRADYGIESENLDAHVEARGVPAIMIDPAYKGVASGTIDLSRRGAAWRGGGRIDATGLALGPGVPVIDGNAELAVAGRRVTVDADATAKQLGGVHVTLAVDGPRDILDTNAWRALPRSAIQDATVSVRQIDLAEVSPELDGKVAGIVTVAGPHVGGTLALRGATTPLGPVEGYVTFAPKAAQLAATGRASITGLGEAAVDASVVIPERPFDPLAWQQLGRGVLGALDARVANVRVAEGQLAPIGLDLPYRGRLDASVVLAAGATKAELTVDLHDVRGGILARPIDVHVGAVSDAAGTRADAAVLLPQPTKQERAQLASAHVDLPVALERWLVATKATALAAPVQGTVAIPELAAATVTSVLGGGAYVIGGGVAGGATVAGTLGAPTGHAKLRAHDVVVAPSLSGKAVPRLDELAIKADWNGTDGALEITGKESDGGWLSIKANGRPDQLATVVGNLGIGKFDLAPFAAFLPGRYAAATGHLSGNVTVRGLDTAGAVRGWVRVDDVTVPLHPLLGTITKANAQLTVDDRELKLRAKSDLGPGKLALDATAPRDLSKIDATLVLDRIQPIIEEQPQISARITATAKRENAIWHARATVARGARVFVPDTEGKVLLDEDTPTDLYFVDEGLPLAGFHEPEKPWLYLDIGFDDVAIESRYLANVDGTLYGQLELDIGESIGVFGSIGIDHATADLFGRRYIVQDGPSKVRFDGDLDPLLDLYLETTDIPDLRLGVSVAGRLDDITYGRQTPAVFSASPGSYDQGQLLGFFMGGSPGNEAVAGGALLGGVTMSRQFRRIKQKLPFDVFSYTPSGLTLGKWFAGHRMFVDWKQHLDAKGDEATNLFEADMFFTKAWSFELSGDDKLFFAGDLLWRHRWR